MPKFDYRAKTKDHKIIKGSLNCESRETVLEILKYQEMTPIIIEKKFSFNDINLGQNKISVKDQYIFTQQLSVMIKAGLPIVEALTILSNETENANMRKLLKNIVSDIKGGSNLSQAFANVKAFPHYYIAVLRSGEKSGKLDTILLRLANHMKQDYQLKSKLKGALVLPIIILIVMIIVIAIVLIFVIPQLTALFTESNVQLPLPTRILIGASNVLQHYWYVFIAGFVIIYFVIKLIAKNPVGRIFFDRLKLKMPIFGKLNKLVTMSRLASTMATLMGSGMPVLEVIDTCADVVDNTIYHDILIKAKKDLEKGKNLSDALIDKAYIPSLVNHMTKIGEKSGNIEYILNELAAFYEDESNNMTKNLMTMLEPLITVVLGIGVAFIVLSVLMPIYGLINATS